MRGAFAVFQALGICRIAYNPFATELKSSFV
jgi:hypothetical protein